MSRRVRVGDIVNVRMPDGSVKEYVEAGDIDLDKEIVLDAQGERITEARAREIAESAMQEYYRRVGRPSLEGTRGSGKKSPHVSFRVPQRLAERAEAVAAREGKSLSQLGREALEKYLDAAADTEESGRRSA